MVNQQWINVCLNGQRNPRSKIWALSWRKGAWSKIADYLTDKTLSGHSSATEAHRYSFIDKCVAPGMTYTYLLSDVSYSGIEKKHEDKTATVTIFEDRQRNADAFNLSISFPNPFNATAMIEYAIPRKTFVRLDVYNLQGKVILPPVNEEKLPGAYSVHIDVRQIASGMYFYRLEAEGRQITKKNGRD